MSGQKKKKSVSTVSDAGFRKTWDKAEYAQIAQTLVQKEKEKDAGVIIPPKPSEKSLLKARDYKVNVDDKLGKVIVVTKDTPLSQSGGFYCNVCDCVIKDSTNFFDHINGRKHQKNLGMSMRVEKSSLSQVQERLKLMKSNQEMKHRVQEIDYESKLRSIEAESKKSKEEKKIKREEERKARRDAALLAVKMAQEIKSSDTQTNELEHVMGFSGFSSSKV